MLKSYLFEKFMMGKKNIYYCAVFLYIVYILIAVLLFQFPVQHFGQPLGCFKMCFIKKERKKERKKEERKKERLNTTDFKLTKGSMDTYFFFFIYLNETIVFSYTPLPFVLELKLIKRHYKMHYIFIYFLPENKIRVQELENYTGNLIFCAKLLKQLKAFIFECYGL